MCAAMQHGKTLVWEVGLKKIRTFVGKILAPSTLLCLWCLHKPAYHHLIWQIELSKKQGALVSCVQFSSAHHHLLSEQKDGRNRNCGPDNNAKKCRPRKQAKEALPKFQFWFVMSFWVCQSLSRIALASFESHKAYLLSDPSPIIGYACHSLPNSLTHSLLFSKLDGYEWYQLLDDVATATESCEKVSKVEKVV